MTSHLAAALVLATVAAACSTSPSTSDGPTTEPTTSASASETPTSSPSPSPTADATQADLSAFPRPGEAVTVGDGRVLAAGTDGRSLLIAADDPDDGERLACEGTQFEYLWRIDVDVPDERSLAIVDTAAQDQPYLGNVLASPAGDRLLLVGSCEGFLGDIHVADLAPDATVTNLRQVEYPPGEWSSWSIEWTPEGDAFTMTAETAFGGSGAILLFVDTGEWLDVSSDALLRLVFTEGDRVVEVTADGQVVWLDADGSLLAELPGDDAVASPDGKWLVVPTFGIPGSVTLVDPAGEVTTLAETSGFAPGFSPDGTVVTWLYSTSDDRSAVALRHIATGRQHDLSDVGFGAPVFLDGGIAYTGLRDDPEFQYLPIVRYRPWEQ